MQHHNAVILFARNAVIDRGGPNEPFAALPWDEIDALFTAMLSDVLESVSDLPRTDVLLYRAQTDISDEFVAGLGDRVKCFEVDGGSFPEQVQQAVDNTFTQGYHRVLVLLENNPLLQTMFLKRAFDQLSYEEDCFVVVPTIEGKCLLVGMKANHSNIFDNTEGDPIASAHVLLERLCTANANIFPAESRFSLDSGARLVRLRNEIETRAASNENYPTSTLEIFRRFDKKYTMKKLFR